MTNERFCQFIIDLQQYLTESERSNLNHFYGGNLKDGIRNDHLIQEIVQPLFGPDQDEFNPEYLSSIVDVLVTLHCLEIASLVSHHLAFSGDNLSFSERTLTIDETFTDLLNAVQEKRSKEHHIKKPSVRFNISEQDQGQPKLTVLEPTEETSNKQQRFISIVTTLWAVLNIIFLIVLIFLIHRFVKQSREVYKLRKQVHDHEDSVKLWQLRNEEINRTHEASNKEYKSIQENMNRYLIRPGKRYGRDDGILTDESSNFNSSCFIFLRGISGSTGFYPSKWFQFSYSFVDNPHEILNQSWRGFRRLDEPTEQFIINQDERIIKVQLAYGFDLLHDTQTNITVRKSNIHGIRIFTDHGRSSPPIGNSQDIIYTEKFDGYHVSYVAVVVHVGISQIQFFWSRIFFGS